MLSENKCNLAKNDIDSPVPQLKNKILNYELWKI
jgi:hypothetical protein